MQRSKGAGVGAGTRRARARPHDGLTTTQCVELLDAAAFARHIGRPLNRYFTMHLERGGAADVLRPFARFRKLMADWLWSRGVEPVFLWVREGGDDKGEHVHMFLYVPDGKLARALSLRHQRWWKAAELTFVKRVMKADPVGRSYAAAHAPRTGPDDYGANLRRAVGYVLKGAMDPEAVERAADERLGPWLDAWGVRPCLRGEPQGCLTGKRCGTSENIGRAARSRSKSDPLNVV